MTQNEQPEDLIRYDVLTQEALRDVIRKVLEEVAAAGLPGEHHFFITFRTDHPGVRLSARMRERYPEEMTIVIQHSFWDLNVSENHFEIDLSFDDILERLRVPFSSLKGFFDPHVKFGVQFDAEYLEAANADIADEDVAPENPENLPQVAQTREMTKAKPKKSSKKKEDVVEVEEAESSEEEKGSAEIVSLDKFRKKQ
ncbi:MAG: ClpXP protease specificity-enhancing factor SspB [Pseudomonadota bacterium]